MNLLKIGHRGAKGHLAENTLESIQKALHFKVDAIEIDVHRCKTGELVVIHDFTLDRTTNGSGEVAKKSLTEIKSLNVEGQYKVPLLTEVLDLIQGKCIINIELKGLNTATSTAEIIKKYIAEKNWNYKDFIVSSFQKNELFQMRKLDGKVALGILSKASVTEAIELGKLLNASAIHPSLGIITRDNVKASHKAGFNVNVWTVNEPEDIARMRAFGVDGIISDFPDRLL
ncbi:glycerophosphodiester phosphodiesterase [Salegentibacter salarius]|uniref:Glycerophosphodiester phosphodiesterase n=1 Tax=Salegentibacter salarius TaxID=435906 RepID=A0A2N0TYP8_9FLAO|nr:glycerophosphodiester phosphodiesterase family protein [Salegentibacter salarius]OEY72982.1 glycerophosphodiester phosphodiesterase [Salegentibacter salarius]PKD19880.1 glycerophosphodiester phosphodiesterase [Salegentibacter salarius]SLJ87159.1 glycerophosphoryl diester phosphodiesterase [Salegentibacter salarius]